MDSSTFWRRCTESASLAPYYVLASDAWDGTGGFAAPLDEITQSATGASQPTQAAYKTRSYVLRHPQEEEEKWRWRVRNACYSNLTRAVGETILGFLFSRAPHRDWPAGSDWEEWTADIDGLGTSLDEHERGLALRLLLHGTAIGTVDRTAGEHATQADAAAAGARTYASLIDPASLYDWRTDEAGQLVAAKLVDEQQDGGLLEEASVYARARIVEAGKWETWRQDGAGKAPQSVGSGTLPAAVGLPLIVQTLEAPIGGGLLGTTIFRQIVDEQLQLYRLQSVLFEHIHMQNFALLCKPQAPGAQPEPIVIGTNNALGYDKDGSAPSYIAPPASVADTTFRAIEQSRTRIYELLGLDALRGGQQAESGVARQWRFNPLNRRLAALANRVRQYERRLLKLRAAWEGLDVTLEGYKCEFPADFDVCDVERQLKIAIDAQLLPLGATARNAMLRSIRSDLVPQLTPEETAASNAEIAEGQAAAAGLEPVPAELAPEAAPAAV